MSMVTQSDSTPNVNDNDNSQNPATTSQPAEDDSKAEATRESSPTSVFVNTEPIREDQVQNAVKFLSHPRVMGSPVMYRRSFLERKGLTKGEIDEAFRRVPDPTPSVSGTQTIASNEDEKMKSSSTSQPLAVAHNLQSSSALQSSTVTKMGCFSWLHAVLAVGMLAASGAGTAVLFRRTIIPRLKSWIRKVVVEEEDDKGAMKGKPSLAEEATIAAKAAAAAAADVALVSQEMLVSKTAEKRYFQELTNLLNYQAGEIKSMSSAIQKLEGKISTSGRIPVVEQDDRRISVSHTRQSYGNGVVDVDARSVRSLSPPASVEPSVAPHPKSYMDFMAMIQRGEMPANIRDINDQPPNPNQHVPDPRVAPIPKPWEVGRIQNSTRNLLQSQGSGDGLNYGYQDNVMNGDGSTPWWQRKNVRVTEIETENEQKFGSTTAPTEVRPVQRSWVPPQPPPVAMAEAAAAIRQPKRPLLQKEKLTDGELMPHSWITDAFQRITKISESGGLTEANGSSSGQRLSETPITEIYESGGLSEANGLGSEQQLSESPITEISESGLLAEANGSGYEQQLSEAIITDGDSFLST